MLHRREGGGRIGVGRNASRLSTVPSETWDRSQMVRVCWAEQLEVDTAHARQRRCMQTGKGAKRFCFGPCCCANRMVSEYERRPSQRLGLPVSITLQQRHIPPHAIPRVVGVNNHSVAPWEARAQEASLRCVALVESHSSAGASPRVL